MDVRVLVVLDNAASAEQVAPLLPGAPGRRLHDLVADFAREACGEGEVEALRAYESAHRPAARALADTTGDPARATVHLTRPRDLSTETGVSEAASTAKRLKLATQGVRSGSADP